MARRWTAYCLQLGLRERILALPVVMALLWRQVGSVGELVRMLGRGAAAVGRA